MIAPPYGGAFEGRSLQRHRPDHLAPPLAPSARLFSSEILTHNHARGRPKGYMHSADIVSDFNSNFMLWPLCDELLIRVAFFTSKRQIT